MCTCGREKCAVSEQSQRTRLWRGNSRMRWIGGLGGVSTRDHERQAAYLWNPLCRILQVCQLSQVCAIHASNDDENDDDDNNNNKNDNVLFSVPFLLRRPFT